MLPSEVLQDGYWVKIPNHQFRAIIEQCPKAYYLYHWLYSAVAEADAKTKVEVETPIYRFNCTKPGCEQTEWEFHGDEDQCRTCGTWCKSDIVSRIRAKVLWGTPISIKDIAASMGMLKWRQTQAQLNKLVKLNFIERSRDTDYGEYRYYIADCYKFDTYNKDDRRLVPRRRNQKREPVVATTKAPEPDKKQDTSSNTASTSPKIAAAPTKPVFVAEDITFTLEIAADLNSLVGNDLTTKNLAKQMAAYMQGRTPKWVDSRGWNKVMTRDDWDTLYEGVSTYSDYHINLYKRVIDPSDNWIDVLVADYRQKLDEVPIDVLEGDDGETFDLNEC